MAGFESLNWVELLTDLLKPNESIQPVKDLTLYGFEIKEPSREQILQFKIEIEKLKNNP